MAIVGTPDPTHETHSPVRDERELGATEDLDRQPDGVPHRVVGLTALFSVMLALLVAAMLLVNSTFTRVGGVILALIAIPVIVMTLRDKSEHERDHVHPSR
jgi:hypothetical protein